MIRENQDHAMITGAESSAKAILSQLMNNGDCRSGFLGVNDKLKIVSSRFFKCNLKNVSFIFDMEDRDLERTTGIIAFDLVDNNLFVSDSTVLNKLNCSCEALGITLIDVMLFGADYWISLRQQNRL